MNRGEVGAAWQLADRIGRNVSPTDVREKRTGCLYICSDDFSIMCDRVNFSVALRYRKYSIFMLLRIFDDPLIFL